MPKSTILLLFPLLLILSCSTAKRALDTGNHKDAVWKALSKLKKKPDDSKSREVLKAAYPLFLDDYEQNIVDLKQNQDPFKWEEIQENYEIMEEVYTNIRAISAARKIVNAQSYNREIYEAKENALKARYDAGIDLLANKDRANAKKAFRHFDFILKRQDRYKDSSIRLEEAREAATLYVGISAYSKISRIDGVIENGIKSIASTQTKSIQYELNVLNFEAELVEELMRSNNQNFIQFIDSSNRYNVPLEKIDHTIEIHFYDFLMGYTHDREQVFNRSKDNVATQEVTIGDSTFTKPIIVEAEVHCFTREISSSGRMELEIFNRDSQRRERQKKFDGSHIYTAKWGYFTGDNRALDTADTNCLNQRNPPPRPRAEELFTEVTIPIYDQTLEFLERYYSNY